MEVTFKTRGNKSATFSGMTNRFGHRMYFVHDRIKKPNLITGHMELVDCDIISQFDNEGRCVHPCNPEYDSIQYARREEQDSTELHNRRKRDNWL